MATLQPDPPASGEAISVIVPCFDSEEYLDESLRSVAAQLREDDEIVVIDDGSTDGSVRIASELEAEFAGVRLVTLPCNQGVATARNVGLSNSANPLVAFHDSDDHALPGRLDIQRAFLSEHPEIDLVGSGWKVITPGHQELTRISPPEDHARIVQWLECARPSIHNPTTMMRRSALDGVGTPFRPTLRTSSDADLWFRLLEGGVRFANVGKVLHSYTAHGSQLSSGSVEQQIWTSTFVFVAHRERFEGRSDPLTDWTGFPDLAPIISIASQPVLLELVARLRTVAQRYPGTTFSSQTDDFLAAHGVLDLATPQNVSCRNIRPLLRLAQHGSWQERLRIGTAVTASMLRRPRLGPAPS